MKISTMKCAMWIVFSLFAVNAFGSSCDSLAKLALKDTTTQCSGRTSWKVRAAGRDANRGWGQSLQRAARILPCGCDSQAVERFRYQGGSLAAGFGLEREIPGCRERRLVRIDQSQRNDSGAAARLCHEFDRYRTHGGQRSFCHGSSRETDRLRVAVGTRDDGEGQGSDPQLLRYRAETLLLERLFDWRQAGVERGADVPG